MPLPRRSPKPSRDRILVAAEALFASRGYGETSLRQLIAAAGVSTTAFYARFPSKLAVLETLTEQLFVDLQAQAVTVLRDSRDVDEGIKRAVDLLVDHFGSRKALVRLVIAESGALPTVVATRRRSYAMLAAFLARHLQRLNERRRISIIDPEIVAWAIIGALELQIVRWAVWDELPGDHLRGVLRVTAKSVMPKERS
jgi:TetR/AcrR family fatty acid metabolism transcriptional regulator